MIFAGKYNIRGIYIYNTINKKSIRALFDFEILKNVRLDKTLTWYLGDRKEIILLRFKNAIDVEIPELEKYKINNYV